MPELNPEEIFDVVNDRDEVIGQAPRGEVHRRGLKHRAVHVLVFNRQGQLYLQKRSMVKDCFPGAWDSSASGHLDAGEGYDACAVRELAEELGWRAAQPLTPLFKIDACPGTGQEFVWVYRFQAEGPFALDPAEIEAGGWFDLASIARWLRARPTDFAPSVLLIWERLARSGALPQGHDT
jgi:isopentenyldiphosphate isomerase